MQEAKENKLRPAWLLVGAVLIAGLLGVGVWHKAQRSRVLSQRMADVGELLQVYGDVVRTNNAPALSDLLVQLGCRNVSLHCPLAKDASLPCYRIANRLAAREREVHGSMVIIEETDNVTDPRKRVRGYADGSIRVEPR